MTMSTIRAEFLSVGLCKLDSLDSLDVFDLIQIVRQKSYGQSETFQNFETCHLLRNSISHIEASVDLAQAPRGRRRRHHHWQAQGVAIAFDGPVDGSNDDSNGPFCLPKSSQRIHGE